MNGRALRSAFVLLAVGTAASRGTSAGDARTVVLLPLAAPEGPDSAAIAEAARDVLAEALSSAPDTRLVERERLDALLAEQHVAGAIEGRDVPRIGALVHATHAVSGAIARADVGWRFSLTLMRVPDGSVVGTAVEVAAGKDLGAAAARVAGSVARLLAGASGGPSIRVDERAGASLHFLRGLGLHRAGLEVEAIGELLEARRRASRFPETRYWTAQAYEAAGLSSHAAIAYEAFLAECPRHALADDARTALRRTREAPASAPPRPVRPPSLAETLLSDPTDAEGAAAIDRAISAGPAGLDALEAAVDLAEDVSDVVRMLEAIAAADPDRFVAFIVRNAEFLHYGQTWRRFRDAFTPDRATRLARGLLSKHAPTRDEVVQFLAGRLQSPIHLAPEALAATVAVVLEAAKSTDAGVSLTAISLLGDTPEVLRIVASRVLDEGFDVAYRAEALRQCEAHGWSSAELCDAVLTLMGDERSVLRSAALFIALGTHRAAAFQPPGPERTRIEALPLRFAARALEILLAREFPDDAYAISMVVREHGYGLAGRDAAAAVLARSRNADERHAAIALFSSPEAAEKAAATMIDDADERVRCLAVGILGRTRHEPEAMFHAIVRRWRERFGEAPVTAGYALDARRCYGMALVTLATTIRRDGRPPAPPVETATADAWEAWLRK